MDNKTALHCTLLSIPTHIPSPRKPYYTLPSSHNPSPHAHSSQALMTTLSDCLGHEPGYLNLALDIFLRRGVITASAAADWATGQSVLENVLSGYWSHKHLEVTPGTHTHQISKYLHLFLVCMFFFNLFV
jgi:hypothetical protein